ncbi:hypothetical protein TheveDRAFT_0406 [Thermanaerovibrio velox DSM 12556]|uniref:Thioredoxin domain-containing protein n=1 Tax=Thermanaerovibrio velox DSM 12556 TaxID=926567 RepID=H0UPM3_9BACT|nr:hypothetical protein [Thermanaerovibrio velox]EHM09570.1 hypothetical protein TheveDRAFT_0406 [Thermanaerovibrio velox DSM 12556]
MKLKRVLGTAVLAFAVFSMGYGARDAVELKGAAEASRASRKLEIRFLSLEDGYCGTCHRMRERLKLSMGGPLGDLLLNGEAEILQVDLGKDGNYRLLKRYGATGAGILLLLRNHEGEESRFLKEAPLHLSSQEEFDRYLMKEVEHMLQQGGSPR